jgi:hypothetical protein
MSAEPMHGRVKWRLAVVDLDREGGVIAELEQSGQQAQEADQPQVQEPAAAWNAASAYVLDPEGRMITELKQPAQRLPEEQEAEQTELPAGGGQLLGPALQQRIALAFRPVLGVAQLTVQLGIAQAPQLMGHGWHEGQQRAEQPQEDEQSAVLAAVLDHKGRVIAELKPLHAQERPQTKER